jgi:hypothetical protein
MYLFIEVLQYSKFLPKFFFFKLIMGKNYNYKYMNIRKKYRILIKIKNHF